MKQKYSNKWIASKQPRKQRKYRANAPIHKKHKMMSSNLSKELKKKYQRKSFAIRKGDKVKVMRGEFKKSIGKIETINRKKLRLTIEGINRTKKDGTKINVWFDASKIQIQELNLEDKKRKKSIEKQENKNKQGEKQNAPKKK